MSDLAALAAGFADRLRRAGVMTTTEQAGRFAQAVRLLSPASLPELYWAARATLVTAHDQLPLFDAVFAEVFAGVPSETFSRGDENAPRAPSARPPDRKPQLAVHRPGTPTGRAARGLRAAGSTAGTDDDRQISVGFASREERLARRDFAGLGPDELADIRHLLADIRLALPSRRGRRSRRHRRGDDIDLRATLRQSGRSAGHPARLVRRSPRPIPRRLVVICDISGSMEPYALAYVHFLHAAASGSAAARAEVFTFATRLTRLTKALSERDVEAALRRAASKAPDWQGGTRIGEALKTFLDSFGRRGLARGAVVILMSDGWERDDPEMLGEQMSRLHRLAHRVVWVNPRSSDPRYEPLAAGMAAALPHCDLFVSGHSVEALHELATALGAGG